MCYDFDPKMSGLKGVLIHRVVCCAVVLGLLTKFDVSGSSNNHLMMIFRRFINKPISDLFILNGQFSMDYFFADRVMTIVRLIMIETTFS